jgi:hypothetical protein
MLFLDGDPFADRSSRFLEGKKDSLPITKPFLGFVLRPEKIGGAGGGGGIEGFIDLLCGLFDCILP